MKTCFQALILLVFLSFPLSSGAAAPICSQVFQVSERYSISVEKIETPHEKLLRDGLKLRDIVYQRLAHQENLSRILPEIELIPWRLTVQSHRELEPASSEPGRGLSRAFNFIKRSSGTPLISLTALQKYISENRLHTLTLTGLEKVLRSQEIPPSIYKRDLSDPIQSVKSLTGSEASWSADLPAILQTVSSLSGNARDSRFRTELSERTLRWLVLQRDQGDTTHFIDSVAQAYREWMILQPFGEKTELAAQVLSQIALQDRQLPPTRLLDGRRAIELSLAEWKSEFREGLFQYAQMIRDFETRTRLHLSFEHSPWMSYAHIPLRVEGGVKLHNRNQSEKADHLFEVDQGQFMAFAEQWKKGTERANQDPVSEYLDMAKAFNQFTRKTQLDFLHAENGWEKLHVEFVDPEFMSLFGKNTALIHKDLYEYKINRWYTEDVLWRGWSHLERVIPEHEMLRTFTAPNGQLVANMVLHAVYSKKPAHEVIRYGIEAMKLANRELYQWQPYFEMMMDHHREGPRYRSSYGFSTSASWTVGRAFAMGAMRVAPYGQQHLHQDKVMSRILIGMRRARKDADQMRLRQFEPSFSYKYSRQKEVTGVGMAEPDSVVIVQRINPEGVPDLTFLRSPEDPSIILRIEGDFRLDRGDDWRAFPYTKINLPL